MVRDRKNTRACLIKRRRNVGREEGFMEKYERLEMDERRRGKGRERSHRRREDRISVRGEVGEGGGG